MPGPTPDLNAMLICDTVITDRNTGKNSVIGIFDRIWASSFPVTHPSLTVYARIIDAQGQYVFKLELVDLTNNQTSGGGTVPPIEVPDRMIPADLVFKLQGLTFPADGRYEFRLYADDNFVGVHSFQVRLHTTEGGTP